MIQRAVRVVDSWAMTNDRPEEGDLGRLAGYRPPDSASIPDASEIDDLGEMTDTRVYEGELESRTPDSDQPDESAVERLDLLVTNEARAGETDDAYEAAEEGLTWIPPVDPPLRAGELGQPEVAAGFGTTAGDEPFDLDHHADALPNEDERTARVIEALRADAATATVADRVAVDTEGSRVVLSGSVEDIDDEEAVLGVASSVTGIGEVENRIAIRTLGERRSGEPSPASAEGDKA